MKISKILIKTKNQKIITEIHDWNKCKLEEKKKNSDEFLAFPFFFFEDLYDSSDFFITIMSISSLSLLEMWILTIYNILSNLKKIMLPLFIDMSHFDLINGQLDDNYKNDTIIH